MKDRTIHRFDTFEEMPEVDHSIDIHQSGDFAQTSLESVMRFLSPNPRVHFHRGLFPQTAQNLVGSKFCFAHIDVDIYQSIKEAIEFFYDKILPGGVMIFDDYDTPSCPGVKKAVDEFLANKPEIPMVLARGQCVIIKKY